MLEEIRVEQIISEICDSYTNKRNGGFNARCPVCGDSKKSSRIRRLHIDWYEKYDSWVVTCYNGGCSFHSGNLYSLYATVKGISYNEAVKIINREAYDINDIKSRLNGETISKPPSAYITKDNELDLDLSDVYTISDVTNDKIGSRYINALRDFVKSRYITNICYVAHSGRYKGRIIIPVYINNDLVYFQGRSLFDNIEPKYLNPIVDKSSIIMNSDKFNRDKWIIITEGIIDAWMIEDNQGTSVLGAYFDDSFIEKVFNMTDKGVIICFDNPYIDTAGMDVFKQFTKESKFNNKVKYFLPNRRDFKDLNELRGLITGSMYNYVIKNSHSLFNATVKASIKV